MKINFNTQKGSAHKSFAWAILVVGSALVGFLFSLSPGNVVRANFTTQGGATNSSTAAYIPNNYRGSPNDAGTISVIVGTADIPVTIKRLRVELDYNENQIVFDENAVIAGMLTNSVLSGATSKTATISIPVAAPQKKLTVVIMMPVAGVRAVENDILFKLPLTIASGAAVGPVALSVPVFHVVAASTYAESDPTFSAGNVIAVVAQALPACTEAELCNAWTSCDLSGNKARTCDRTPPVTCNAVGVTPALTGICVCTTAETDWKSCSVWGPATCPVSGQQTRTGCVPNNCSDSQGRQASMLTRACTYVAPTVSNVTNCPANVLGAAHLKAHPNMVLRGPAGAWTLDAVARTAEADGSLKLSGLSTGDHEYGVTLAGGAACRFRVECYTSIDTANARNSIGSTDPAKILLYDYDANGSIDAVDKLAIFNASKSCN